MMRFQVLICLAVQFLLAIRIDATSVKVNNTSDVVVDSTRTLITDEDLYVCVSEGCLQGKSEGGNKEFYRAFYGIPYATPPVERLRFKEPVPPQLYEEKTWDATYPRDKCIQTDYITNDIEGSEDCLYLNVYAPNKKLLHFRPVLVFIHGGAFKIGEASPHILGPDFFMDTEQVVVVTLNYRLGVFGFLSSGDQTLRGNLGLKDQNMALQWIKKNIINFGGDPKRITLWGDSAGGASVHYHMMSARSNGLFHKVIIAGGNAFAPWALNKKPQQQFRQFAAIAGVEGWNTRETRDLFRDIKRLSATDLQKYATRMYIFHPIFPVFVPVIEGVSSEAMVPEDPKVVWARGSFQKRPMLFVISSFEGGKTNDVIFDPVMKQRLLTDSDNSLMEIASVTPRELGVIKRFYFNGAITEQNIGNVSRLQRDRDYRFPSFDVLEKFLPHQDAVNTIDMMKFSFTTTFSATHALHQYTQANNGPSKMDNLLYFFRNKALDSYFQRGPAEDSAKDLMIFLWMKFILTGFQRTAEYPPCTARQIVPGSFCKYMLVVRANNMAELQITDVFARDDEVMRKLNSH